MRASLLLRPHDGEGLADQLAAMAGQEPRHRVYLSAEEFATRYGASQADVDTVSAFAAAHQLEVASVNRPGRLVELTGSPLHFARAFGVEFETVAQGSRSLRRPTRPVALPAALHEVVEAVFGLDELPKFTRHDRSRLAILRRRGPRENASQEKGSREKEDDSALAKDLAEGRARVAQVEQGFQFPSQTDGSGQTLAVILLGGGFYQDDMEAYFSGSPPRISMVELDGAGNDPAPRKALNEFIDGLATGTQPNFPPELHSQVWWTLEATVDLQVLGSFAPGAHLVAYFAPNDERGKIDALTAAITDPHHRPSVITCSWGMCESDADPDFVTALDRIFQMAATRGITICYSSGDQGADPDASGTPRVHFPASSPHALACGGTLLELPHANPQTQTAWNESQGTSVLATGGGFSNHFSRPAWQSTSLASDGEQEPGGRGVPDVAGKADYACGYLCLLVGRAVLGGGTSVATPMWAALLARLNQALGTRVGWLTPLLYSTAFVAAFQDITQGTNDGFAATPDWDACTGLGTPSGEALLKVLGG